MTEIWNLDALCRCCHKDGYFRSMQYPYVGKDGDVEVYTDWLHDTLGITMEDPIVKASTMICEDCVTSLRNARAFKRQVTECELKFRQYCRNECNIKVEAEDTAGTVNLPNHSTDEDKPSKSEDTKSSIKVENTEDFPGFESAMEFSEAWQASEEPTSSSGKSKKADKKVLIKNPRKRPGKKIGTPKKMKTQSGPAGKRKKAIKTASGKKELLSWTCIDCERTYESRRSRRAHQVKTHGYAPRKQGPEEERWKCKYCCADFVSKATLTKHLQKHGPDEPMMLSRGKKTEKVKEPIKREPYVCEYCSMEFPGRYYLNSHINAQHRTTKQFECDFCGKRFGNKPVIRRHILMHLGLQKSHTCHICGHGFNDKTNMAQHIKAVHQNIRAFQCEYCPKSYKEKKLLVLHTRQNHTMERPYACHACPMGFVSRWFLTQHVRRYHTEENRVKTEGESKGETGSAKRYRCYICKAPCIGRRAYNAHLKNEHAGQLPFTCHICGRSFTSKYILDRHCLSHNESKDHECEFCHRRFKHELFLTAHIKRTHGTRNRDGTLRVNKEDYVKCDLCKRLVQNLDQHMKSHLDKPHQCTVCYKSYSQKNALTRHVKEVHLQMYQFSCLLCPQKFIRERTLVKHMKKKHPDVKTEIEIDTGAKDNDLPSSRIGI